MLKMSIQKKKKTNINIIKIIYNNELDIRLSTILQYQVQFQWANIIN